ncbi:MAG TPA: beta-galactosidase, partial [Pseudoduganella sp.]
MPKIAASFRRRPVSRLSHLVHLALAALALQANAQELGIPQASDMQQRQAQAGTSTNAPVFLMAAVPLSAEGKFSVYSSSDGVTFTTLASEAHAPGGTALTDPSIVRHGGQYHAVYAQGASLAIARSADLKRWETLQAALPAIGGGAQLSAPRWIQEKNGTLKVVVASGDRTYILTPNADFTQWSAPQAVQGLPGGASIVATDDGYAALVRSGPGGMLEVATAPALAGPWKVAQQGSGPGASSGGQSLARLADGTWRAYFRGADGRAYWYADSRDNLRTWSPKAKVGGVSGMIGSASVISDERKAFAAATKPKGQPRKVSWDEHSLMVDGKRIVVWSGEVHPFRLPSPSLWRDVIQKMKAVGFNGIAFYFDWGYHSPAPGVYDFAGIRNMERAIEIAEEEGMYIIARTGPYVNAELTGGGYPGWMFRNRAEARTDDPAYLAAADEWMTQINAIIGRHQISDGGGNVIAYQLENELGKVEPKHVRQMDHLAKKARADGITVPFFHNAAGRLPDWTPKNSTAPWANSGPTDIYAFDGYPGGSCNVFADPSGPNKAPDWG